MIKKIVLHIVAIYVLLLLQTTVADSIKFFEIKPNFLLTYVLCVAILFGKEEGAIIGGVTGLCMDIFSIHYFGIYLIMGVLTGYVVGNINHKYFEQKWYVIGMCVFSYSFVYEMIMSLVYKLITGNVEIIYSLRYIVIPQSAYSMVISVLMYFILRLFLPKEKEFEESI